MARFKVGDKVSVGVCGREVEVTAGFAGKRGVWYEVRWDIGTGPDAHYRYHCYREDYLEPLSKSGPPLVVDEVRQCIDCPYHRLHSSGIECILIGELQDLRLVDYACPLRKSARLVKLVR